MSSNGKSQDNSPCTSRLKNEGAIFEAPVNRQVASVKKDGELPFSYDRDNSSCTLAFSFVEDDLLKNNSSIQKIIELCSNIIHIYDLEHKRSVYSNISLGRFLGYLPTEINSLSEQLFEKLLHPDDVESVAEHYRLCEELIQGDYFKIEYRLRDKQGNWHWLESKDTVFNLDSQGKAVQILGVIQDITETKKNQLEASRLNLELAEKVNILETWHDKRLKLATMNEFLQACLTMKEAEMAIADLLEPLFPNTHGVVYVINNSENLLQEIASWGTVNNKTTFEPHDCWGLRLGNKHLAYPSTPGVYCKHIDCNTNRQPTLCLPMIAKGKTLGMLYLRFDSFEPISELIQELSVTVAQNIAMSFANLKLQEKLRYQSLRDPLTGLHNRRFLQESLSKEIDRARRQQQFIGILMIDIDRFKKFNDLYGHMVGDLVLKEVGKYLLLQIRQYDIACRYGGEELVIIMPNAAIEDMVIRAEEIRLGVKQLKLQHNNRDIEPITVSIGVSCFPDDGIETNSLIEAADRALYQAKKAGRDRVKRC